ncbi:MAG: ATP-binding protein [Sphingobium sp.]
MSDLLERHGFDVAVYPQMDELAAAITDDVGVALVTEEALLSDLAPLHRALEGQPAWSDIPFILLAGRQAGGVQPTQSNQRRLPESAINVILLERPLSSESLVSAVASAMRARQKQFEIRDRLAELDAERTRLSTLLDNLPVGVAFIDAGGDTIMSNPAFKRFVPDDVIPSRQADAEERWIGYDADGRRIERSQFAAARALRGEKVAGLEFLYRPVEGGDIWTQVAAVPLRGLRGEPAGAVSVIVDIDAQKRGQEALARAAKLLEEEVDRRTAELKEALEKLNTEVQERERAEASLRQAQKMEAVGQLTGGIAHDFNNMLTGVIGGLDVMRRRIAAGRIDDLDRFMDAATTSAQRAAALTARLLAFSRRQSLDSRPTDVNALILSLRDLLDRTVSEQIAVSIMTQETAPAALVDANQLENAVLNLAINARDAMPHGGTLTLATGAVTVDAAECVAHPGIVPGDYVVISVSDTGVGMDDALLEKVFDPFFTTKPIGQGTGLGLSMVYGFAKQSRGQVRITSHPGEGTCVSIYLPVAQDRVEAPKADAAQAVVRGSGQSVLLVEDDASVRMLVRDLLEELGYVAVEAADAQAAVDIFATGAQFDLMISDVGLPGMNGRQLAEIARRHLPALPVLFVTGYAENAAIRSGFLGTNMQMITKPFQIDSLAARIGEMLSVKEGQSDPSQMASSNG